MLLRIFLILSILAGIGVIAISQLQVKPHIQGIIDERETQTRRAVNAETSLAKTRATLKKTEEELTGTKRTLEETQGQLTAANNKIKEQGDRLTQLSTSLDTTQKQLSETQQKLAQWDFIGLQPNEVKGLVDSHKQLVAANEALEEEKKVIQKEYTKVKNQLDVYLGKNDDQDVPMDLTAQGKVLVVDPKWNFVVTDVGEKDGAKVRGVLMVSRNSKLVAKVRITSVQPERSIANIVPEWKLSEIEEGDLVIPQ